MYTPGLIVRGLDSNTLTIGAPWETARLMSALLNVSGVCTVTARTTVVSIMLTSHSLRAL